MVFLSNYINDIKYNHILDRERLYQSLTYTDEEVDVLAGFLINWYTLPLTANRIQHIYDIIGDHIDKFEKQYGAHISEKGKKMIVNLYVEMAYQILIVNNISDPEESTLSNIAFYLNNQKPS